MRILRAADQRRMPWKNGGGETVEIAVEPAGAGLSEFAWRVSTATVASNGPFSSFPGVDRTLAILTGNGMSLEIDGVGHVDLNAASEPLRFPADASTRAELTDGPIVDLNVMTRRGAAKHFVERFIVEAPKGLNAESRWTLLFACGDVFVCGEAGEDLQLGFGDVVLVEDPTNLIVRSTCPTTVYLIGIDDRF